MTDILDGFSLVHADAVTLLTEYTVESIAEAERRDYIISVLAAYENAAKRSCIKPGHITSSALVVDVETESTLLTLHPKFQRWMQLGGHFEETDKSVRSAALREATEESGLTDLSLDPKLLSVGVFSNVFCAMGIPSEHLDLRFLVYADSTVATKISAESIDLQWWPLRALPENSDVDLHLLAEQALQRMSK